MEFIFLLVSFYRPHRFIAMLDEYYEYVENDLMYWAQNKTRFAVKIFREGPLRIHARSGKTESSILPDIRHGKGYYVQCNNHHRLTRAAPELKLVDPADGEVLYSSIE